MVNINITNKKSILKEKEYQEKILENHQNKPAMPTSESKNSKLMKLSFLHLVIFNIQCAKQKGIFYINTPITLINNMID